MAEKLDTWEIWTWDGTDRHNSTGFLFDNQTMAEAYKKANPYDYVNHKQFVIVHSLEDLREAQLEATKERALSKLSPLERQALGFA